MLSHRSQVAGVSWKITTNHDLVQVASQAVRTELAQSVTLTFIKRTRNAMVTRLGTDCTAKLLSMWHVRDFSHRQAQNVKQPNV